MNWLPTKLGSLLTLEYGKALPKTVRDQSGSVPVAGSNGIVGRHSAALVDGPGIVVGRKGSAGKVTWFDDDFWPIDTTYFVKHDPDVTNRRWLYYLLQNKKLDRLATSTGVPGLNRNDAYAESCLLPPMTEQCQIVELLNEAERIRKLCDHADAKCNRILPAIFQRTFGDPATNPRQWPNGTLGSFGVRARYGLSQPPPQSASGLPLLRATNINAGRITEEKLIFVDPEDIPASRNAFLAANEVIVVRSGAYTGDVAQVTEKWAGAVAGYDMVLTPPAGWFGEFIEQFLLTPFVQRNYFESQKSRAGQPHLNSTQLEATPAFEPPETHQEVFSRRVQDIRAMRDTCRAAAVRFETLFGVMLNNAFSGELTGRWREGRMKELLAEIEWQAHMLESGAPGALEVTQ